MSLCYVYFLHHVLWESYILEIFSSYEENYYSDQFKNDVSLFYCFNF